MLSKILSFFGSKKRQKEEVSPVDKRYVKLVDQIITIAHANQWIIWAVDHTKFYMRFARNDEYVDVWYSKMTVGTVINHPKKGRTQMFRRNVSSKELLDIFTDPRTHTGKGYYKRYGR